MNSPNNNHLDQFGGCVRMVVPFSHGFSPGFASPKPSGVARPPWPSVGPRGLQPGATAAAGANEDFEAPGDVGIGDRCQFRHFFFEIPGKIKRGKRSTNF